MSYQKPPTPFPGQQQSYQQPYSKSAPQTSGMAIASLVLGFLSACLSILTGIPAIILGFIAIVKISKSQGTLSGKGLAIGGMVLGFGGTLLSVLVGALMVAGFMPAVGAARNAAVRVQDENDLKAIGLALHTFHDVNRSMPVAGAEMNLDDNKLPEGSQLSWRVHLLPYLEYGALYNEFHLDEPWDSPHNLSLLPRMPQEYKSAKAASLQDGFTTYLAPVPDTGAQYRTILLPSQETKLSDVLDGLSNTLMVIDAGEANAVEWTRPSDYKVDWNNPKGNLVFDSIYGMSVLFGDGSVQSVDEGVSTETLRWLFYANDGNVVPLF